VGSRRGVRTSIGVAAVTCIAAVAGCGGSALPAPPPIRLTIETPASSSTLAGEVTVAGRVAPENATVLVAGNQIAVSGGSFSARVPVRPGANVVDVLAGSAQAPDAMTAVRVYREVPVAIPNLAGQDPSDATAALSALGLTANLQRAGGLLQSLIPVSAEVCATEPPPGRLVAPGSAVTVQVAKLC
jgi:Glucodextranase, domain B/PASTA domain